jgi:serine/threonine protein kinase
VTDLSVNGTYLKKSNSECTGSQGRGILMGPSSTFLLNDGDELELSDTIRLVFNSIEPIKEVLFTPTQERERSVFAQDFLITGRLLGEGGYGKVLIGIDQATQHQVACKIVMLDHLYDRPQAPNLRLPTGPRDQTAIVGKKRWPTRVANCFREFDILKDLSHPNVVSIEKVFWSNHNIYIFQELVTGGDLFSFLEYKGGRLDNAQAVVVIRQILLGVEYLHAQQIVHRDIKPDNILMTSLEDGARVVITDFGNARFLPNPSSLNTPRSTKYQRMFSYVGTLEFAAPEIHRINPTMPANEGYSKSVDMWSIGCVTAVVLTGEAMFTDCAHPLYHKDPRRVIVGLAAQCDLSIMDNEYHPSWREVDPLPKDFIKRLLVLEEDARLTASESLAHGWFSNECYTEDLQDLYIRSIKDWRPRPTDSQLVERIFRALPDLSIIELSGQSMNHDTVSRFFHSSEQHMTHTIMHTLSASQHRRTDTPLPSIRDDYANDGFLFASQAAPYSHVTENGGYTSHYDDAGVDEQEQKYDEYGTVQFDDSRQLKYAEEDTDLRQPWTGQDQATYETTEQDKYTRAYVDDSEASLESTASLNNVNNVAYSQYPHVACAQRPQPHERPEIVLVHGTPLTQDGVNTELKSEDSYQRTRYLGEFSKDGVPREQDDSILVNETPPVGYSSQNYASNDESLSGY